MDNKTEKSSGWSIGFLDLLLVVFIVLKLCKVITWSWWWVLAPLWIPVTISVLLAIIIAVVDVLDD